MEAMAEDKGKTQARKGVEKLWSKWEDQGLVGKDPFTPLPPAQVILCINTAATAAYTKAKTEWEKGGQRSWGPKHSAMKKANHRHKVTLAVCKLMTKAGKQHEQRQKGGTQKEALSAPPKTDSGKGGAYASLYPTLEHVPRPSYQPTLPQGRATAAVQAPQLKLTGGCLEIEEPNSVTNRELLHAVKNMANTVASILEKSTAEVRKLKQEVSEISYQQSMNMPHTSSHPTPQPRAASHTTSVSSSRSSNDWGEKSHTSTRQASYQDPPPQLEGQMFAPHISSDGDEYCPHAEREPTDDEEDEEELLYEAETGPEDWKRMDVDFTPFSGTLSGRFDGFLSHSGTLNGRFDGLLSQSTPQTSACVQQKGKRGQGAPSTHGMDTRSTLTAPTANSIHQLPLRVASGGTLAYVPLAHRDMEGLLSKLPPLADGADEWITTLEDQTMGETLCIGDLRALLGKTEGKEITKKILQNAGLSGRTRDDTPLNTHRNALWTVLRREYPTERNVVNVGDIKIREGEGMLEYLKRAATLWARHTGGRHDKDDATIALWRMQCTKGLPEEVQNVLKEVVGLPRMTRSMWEEHLDHHHRRYQDKKAREKEEVDALSRRLLRQQVCAKDDETDRDKQKAKQMIAAAPIQEEDWKHEMHKAIKEALATQVHGLYNMQ